MEITQLSLDVDMLSRGTTKIVVSGDIAPETAAPLYATVNQALLRRPDRLQLDLQHARITDGDGLFILLALHRRARSDRCALVLTQVPPSIMMLIDGTLLPALITIEGTDISFVTADLRSHGRSGSRDASNSRFIHRPDPAPSP